MTATDNGIAFSLDLQRRGFRVTVQQDSMPGQVTEVTVCLSRRDRPHVEQVQATAATFAVALARAARIAGVKT
jgi:hypothetical protein